MNMNNRLMMSTVILLTMATAVSSIPFALASFNPKIPVNQGTGIVNGIDGCRPPTQSGDYWVYVPSETLDAFLESISITPSPYFHEWEGGPCCPSNTMSTIGNNYPLPNQCCNPPDYAPSPPFPPETPTGEHFPGNHCECFELRGYPFSLLS